MVSGGMNSRLPGVSRNSSPVGVKITCSPLRAGNERRFLRRGELGMTDHDVGSPGDFIRQDIGQRTSGGFIGRFITYVHEPHAGLSLCGWSGSVLPGAGREIRNVVIHRLRVVLSSALNLYPSNTQCGLPFLFVVETYAIIGCNRKPPTPAGRGSSSSVFR